MRILLVEDEAPIAAAVERGLLAEGFEVDVARDGNEGLWRAREGAYAAIILDILLPGMNGMEVCETLRKEAIDTPILMLTAKSGEYDEAEGLDTGADDYLRKPFSFVVLVARVHALLRRGKRFHCEELCMGEIRFNPASHECTFDGQRLDLTGREATVLEVLLRANGEVVSKDALLKQVWGMDFEGDPNIIDVYLGYLRGKFGHPRGRKMLQTIRGVGYRLVGGTA